jgi:hypothetical protein
MRIKMDDRFEVYNPKNLPIDQLPVIYGFNNGGGYGFMSAVAIAEDGTLLGGHCCSEEGYMYGDLGILKGTREDRHQESYQKHYPDGYRMDFVPSTDIKTHVALNKAFELNKFLPEEGEKS